MHYRTLGSTGIAVSVVGLGTWQFGGEWGVSFTAGDVDAVMGAARDAGINLVDTAECYGDHLSERLIGERLQRERDAWVVATKFGHHFHDHMDRTRHWDGADATGQVEASLRALRTDYIDILQYHSPTDEEYGSDELNESLLRLKKSGKVRHLGLSVSKNDNLRQVEEMPAKACEVLQIIYNRLDTTPEERVFPAAQRMDLGVLARVPLASGFLSGKYTSDSTFAAGDWRAEWSEEKRRSTDEALAAIEREEIPEGVPMAQWAIAWALKAPAVTAVIPGCKNVEQVASNAAAANLIEAAETHPQASQPPAGGV